MSTEGEGDEGNRDTSDGNVPAQNELLYYDFPGKIYPVPLFDPFRVRPAAMDALQFKGTRRMKGKRSNKAIEILEELPSRELLGRGNWLRAPSAMSLKCL